MSKKTLLNENTIRRFMKLAEIEPLTNPFFKATGRLYEVDEGELEEQLEAEEDELAGAAEDELGAEADLGGAEMDLGAGEEDLGLEDEEEGLEDEEEGEDDAMEELTQDLADAIGDFLRDKIEDGTLELTVGEDEEEIDLEDEGEEEMDFGEEEMDLGDEEEDEGLEELEEDYDSLEETDYGQPLKTSQPGRGEKEGDEAFVNESIVSQVARRVARRILTSRRR